MTETETETAVIDVTMTTEITAQAPVLDLGTMMIDTTMIETDMKRDVQMIDIEIEKTATAKTEMTDVGPGIETTIMTMIDIINVEGSMRKEIDHAILMIGTLRREKNLPRNQPTGI